MPRASTDAGVWDLVACGPSFSAARHRGGGHIQFAECLERIHFGEPSVDG